MKLYCSIFKLNNCIEFVKKIMEKNNEECHKCFQPCSTLNKNSSKILTPCANCMCNTSCIHNSECKKFLCEESDDDSDEASIDIQVQSQEDLSSVGLLNISYSKLSLGFTASQQRFKINDHSNKYSTQPVINSYNCHHSINFSCNLQHSQSPKSIFNDKQSYCLNQFNQPFWDYHMDFLPRKLAIEESRKRKCGCDLHKNKKEKCGTRTDLLKDFLISSASFEHKKEELSVSEGVSTSLNSYTHNGNINGTSLEHDELEVNEGVSSFSNNYNLYNGYLKEMSLKCKEEIKVNEGVTMSFNSYNQSNGNPEESNDVKSDAHNFNESIEYVDNVNWNGFLTEEHFQQPCGVVSYVSSTASNFGSFNQGSSEKSLQKILINQSISSSNNLSTNDEHCINSSIHDSSRTFDDESIEHDESSRENEKYLQWLYQTDFKVGFIDTHCHIDFLFKKINFNYTFQKFIEFSNKKDPFPKCFEGCVAVFCDPQTFYKISWWENILLSDNVWGAFGCHPHFSHKFGPDEETILKFALHHKKVKAAGEIGLDYSGRNDNVKELQKSVFEKQLTIALEFKKPIVIHCRDAFEDAYEIMKKMLPKNYTIHLHCFTGSLYEARQWMECFPNLYFGFTCIVTQTSKRAMNVRRVVQAIPLNRILLETDTPYFRPVNLKEGSFSHPGMAIHVAATVAEIRQVPFEKVLEETRRNTHDVYNI